MLMELQLLKISYLPIYLFTKSLTVPIVSVQIEIANQ